MQDEQSELPAPRQDDFKEAIGLFNEWRSARSRGARIPKSLWEFALLLAKQHGVARTSRTLKIDYYGLKKRLHPGAEGRARKPRLEEGQVQFVEVPMVARPGGSKCSVEFDGGGVASKVRVELEGASIAEIGTLIRAVLVGQQA